MPTKNLDKTPFFTPTCVISQQIKDVSTGRLRVSGVYAFRGESSIPYESTLERDFVIRHEFNLDVAQVIPQPVSIPFKTPRGRTYSYTPD